MSLGSPLPRANCTSLRSRGQDDNDCQEQHSMSLRYDDLAAKAADREFCAGLLMRYAQCLRIERQLSNKVDRPSIAEVSFAEVLHKVYVCVDVGSCVFASNKPLARRLLHVRHHDTIRVRRRGRGAGSTIVKEVKHHANNRGSRICPIHARARIHFL